MSNIFFPSLSEDGWVTGYVQIADYSLADFFESQYSQSQLYFGCVTSLSYILQSNNGDMAASATAIQSSLKVYLGRYLNNVDVSCGVVQATPDTSATGLTLYVSFTDEQNKTITLSKLLQISNGKLTKVVNTVNG